MRAQFTVDEARTLTQLLDCCAGERVILIGAAALGCHVPMTWRRTHDLDLTIMTDMETAAAALRAAGLVRDPKVEHRWLAHGVRLDVLPATSRDIERKQLVWPSGVIMSLVGFDLAFAHTLPVPLSATCAIQVPTLPVLAMLKVISWLDAPHERSRDLLDLGYLLSEYLDNDAARHWDDPRLAAIEFDKHSPLALGHDIAEIAAPHHRERVLAFLDAFFDTGTRAFQQLAPPAASAMWIARPPLKPGSSGCVKASSSSPRDEARTQVDGAWPRGGRALVTGASPHPAALQGRTRCARRWCSSMRWPVRCST